MIVWAPIAATFTRWDSLVRGIIWVINNCVYSIWESTWISSTGTRRESHLILRAGKTTGWTYVIIHAIYDWIWIDRIYSGSAPTRKWLRLWCFYMPIPQGAITRPGAIRVHAAKHAVLAKANDPRDRAGKAPRWTVASWADVVHSRPVSCMTSSVHFIDTLFLSHFCHQSVL